MSSIDDWISDITVSGQIISYKVALNTSAVARTGSFIITSNGVSQRCVVIQTGHPVTEFTLNKTSMTLLAGESDTLAASVFPVDTRLQWSSTSPAVASVDQNGKVTGLASGTTIITVVSDDGTKTATCMVTVIVPVTGVSLDRTSAEIIKGDSITLIATVTPSNATDKNVMWTSSDPSVATVSQSGVVKALEPGTTTIKANTIDGNKSVSCFVTVVNKPISGGMEGTEDEDWGI